MSNQSQVTNLEDRKHTAIWGDKDELRKEIEVRLTNQNSETVSKEAAHEASFLRARLQSRTYQKKLIAMDKVETISFWKEIMPYTIAAAVFITFSGLLGVAYRKDQVQISITYDVGTITGGILAGSAAVIAATAYARKTTEADRGDGRNG
jgi:hypothetical protein